MIGGDEGDRGEGLDAERAVGDCRKESEGLGAERAWVGVKGIRAEWPVGEFGAGSVWPGGKTG